MSRFVSFSEAEFEQALENKDYSTLILSVVSAIRNNPAFKADAGEKESEAELAVDILSKRVPEIFVQFKHQPGEELFDKEKISIRNKEYFIRQTIFLRENFSKERIEQIKFIGERIVGENTANFSKPQNQNQTGQSNKKQKSRSLNPLILGIALLIIIVLVVALAVKK